MPIVGKVLSLIQTNSGRVLAGTGGNNGWIYFSDDNGITWTGLVGLGDATTRVNAMVRDAYDNVWAAVDGSTNQNYNGIWKGTANGGWNKVYSHPSGTGYLDMAVLQSGTMMIAVGHPTTSAHSPVIVTHNGTTWQNVATNAWTQKHMSAASYIEPFLGSNYDGEINASIWFYMIDGNPTSFRGVGGLAPNFMNNGFAPLGGGTGAGNGGLDMTGFLERNTASRYNRKILMAVRSAANTADTEIWQWPVSPTNVYNYTKIATIAGETFNVLYPEPVFGYLGQTIPALKTVWAGANGKIFVSYNSGLNWVLATEAPVSNILSFVRTASGVMIAGGENGEIYRFSGLSTPSNTAPIAHTQTVNAITSVAKPITLTATDAEGQTLTYTVWPPQHGTITGTAPNIIYTSHAGYVGPDAILFQASDGQLNSTAVNININVTLTPIGNTAPVANSQTVNTTAGVAKLITMTGSDAEGSPLTYAVLTNPTHGTLSGSGQTRTYTPAANYAGPDSFTFRVNDGALNSAAATVTILVEFPPTTAYLGREETDQQDEVFVGNKASISNITHIFHYNGSLYQNLQFPLSPPYYLVGETMAPGNIAYFGSQTNNTEVPGGTFSSLVFNITRALANATMVWEYWNGSAWVTLSVQDNTNGFVFTGTGSVHWHPPTAWTTVAVNGITGYWVRARLLTVGSNPVSPIHGERYIYTIQLPYVEVNENRIGGDLPAIARIQWHNRADNATSSLAMEADRLIVGLRTADRGPNFQAYLNVSDVQLPFGVAVTAGPSGAFGTNKATPTTRALTVSYSAAPSLNVWGNLATFTLTNTVAREYYGSYRAFVRCFKSSGADGVWQVRLRTTFGSGGSHVNTKAVFPSLLADWEVLDFGQISIPTTQVAQQSGNLGDQLTISIQGKCSALSSALVLYDLVLIPIDEWGIDAHPPRVEAVMLSQVKSNNYLDIDSITNPKSLLTVLNRNAADLIVSRYQALNNGPAMLQAGRTQRLWFLTMATTGDYWYAYPSLAGTVRVFRQQRYMTLRGVN